MRSTELISSLVSTICEFSDFKEAIVSQAIKFPQLPEQGRIAGSFPIFLQLSMVVFEAFDAPISRIEVNKHPGAEQDLVKSDIKLLFLHLEFGTKINGYLGLSPFSKINGYLGLSPYQN
jgi:hypothetical protein